MVLEGCRVLLVLFNAVQGDFSAYVVNYIHVALRLCDAVLALDVVIAVVAEVIEYVIGVCRSGVLGESHTTGHVRSEPDLVIQHAASADYLERRLDGVVRVLAVSLHDVAQEAEA